MNALLLHRYPVTILEKHLDTFGHVNNATYLNLFEEARWDWITQRGFGLDEIRKTNTGPVILEVQVRFRRELTNRQKTHIETTLLERKGKITRIVQKVLSEDRTVACDAEFTMGFFDLVQRKLITPTPEWERVLTTPLT